MQVECGIVSVNFVRENLSVIFARQQDFELQGGSWFVFEAPITVRYQQRQELMPLLWCDFNCGNDRKPGHARCSFAAYHLDAARLLRALVVLSKTLRATGPVRNAVALNE